MPHFSAEYQYGRLFVNRRAQIDAGSNTAGKVLPAGIDDTGFGRLTGSNHVGATWGEGTTGR